MMNSDNSFRPGRKCADDPAAAYADAAEFAQLLETSSLGTSQARAARRFGITLLTEHRLEASTQAEDSSAATPPAGLERFIAAQFEANGQVDQAELWHLSALRADGNLAPQLWIDARSNRGPIDTKPGAGQIAVADLLGRNNDEVKNSPKSTSLLVAGLRRSGRGRHRTTERKFSSQRIIPIAVLTVSAAVLIACGALWIPRTGGELENTGNAGYATGSSDGFEYTGVSTTTGLGGRTTITISDNVLGFAGSSLELDPKVRYLLHDTAARINGKLAFQPDASVTIYGYTADLPGSNLADHQRLSAAHAQAVADALIANGLTHRVVAIGGGIAPGMTAMDNGVFNEAIAVQMRRIEITYNP
jgi:flagellar motor protein MotB